MMRPQQQYNQPGTSAASTSARSPLLIDDDIFFRNNDIFESNNDVGSKENNRSENVSSNSMKDESVDSILANELNKLTFHERESINDEIHGINIDRQYIEESGAVEETPELLFKSLKDMQSDLDILRSTASGIAGIAWAFNRSQEIFESHPDGTYFNNTEFRLMFLRCERFDCKKAAKRLCLYADLMFEAYGDFALGRQPRLSDLDDDDMDYFARGSCMFFPGRDRAGRRIYMHLGDNSQPSHTSRLRVCAYCIMSMLSHDVDSQRRGIVAVMWMHNVTNMDVMEFARRGKNQSRHLASIPVRFGAGHYCFRTSDIAKGAAFLQIISRFTGQVRPHVRIHSGSPMECVYRLESFGISSKQHPLDMATGKFDLKNHMRWLRLRAAREKNATKLKHIIECPNHSDILSGRGQIAMVHPGNTVLRDFVQRNLEIYSNLQSKAELTKWTRGVVRTLKRDYGARFLKEERIDKDITAWVEVSNEIARSKVRIAFRDARKRQTMAVGKETKKPFLTGSNGIVEPTPIAESSLSILSKRKNGSMSTPNASFHQPQNLAAPGLESRVDALNENITQLNNNISQLNKTLKDPVQVSCSSTLDFVGLDGSNNSKRQRLDSEKICFDLF